MIASLAITLDEPLLGGVGGRQDKPLLADVGGRQDEPLLGWVRERRDETKADQKIVIRSKVLYI